jgi:hypothetical protein
VRRVQEQEERTKRVLLHRPTKLAMKKTNVCNRRVKYIYLYMVDSTRLFQPATGSLAEKGTACLSLFVLLYYVHKR